MNKYFKRFYIFKKILPYMKGLGKCLVSVAIFKIIISTIVLATPLFYKILLNEVIFGENTGQLTYVVIGYLVIMVVQILGNAYYKYYSTKSTIKLNLKLKERIIRKYSEMKVLDLDGFNFGDLKKRLTDDTIDISNFYDQHILDYVYSILNIVILTIIMFFINWYLTLFGLLMMVLALVFSKFMEKKLITISNEYRDADAKHENFIHGILHSWKEIKANNLKKYAEMKLEDSWKVMAEIYIRQRLSMFVHGVYIAFKLFFITRMSLYFFGGLLILNNRIDIPVLLVFMAYYEQFFNNVTKVANSMAMIAEVIPGINRGLEILELPHIGSSFKKATKGDVSIHNISFKYRETEEYALDDLNIMIKENEHVAIVGESGSGKSTLVKLMLGLYKPQTGKIMVGNTTLTDMCSTEINGKVMAVMQNTTLFNLSIIDNFRLMKPRITDSEIRKACEKANIFDFIQSLPDKFETVLGDKGAKISGGQLQRIIIAISFLSEADILIYDESTAALDHMNERLVMDAIRNLSSGKTLITIAHRLSTVMNCDKIIFLNKGKVTMEGRYEELKDRIDFVNHFKSI